MKDSGKREQITLVLSSEQLARLGETADRLGVARAELSRWAVLSGLAKIERDLLAGSDRS